VGFVNKITKKCLRTKSFIAAHLKGVAVVYLILGGIWSQSLLGARKETAPVLQAPPHMDLEMTGFEYEKLLEARKVLFSDSLGAGKFDDILATGKRNLDWIRVLNANRSDKISLSQASTQQGFPMHAPRTYNPTLIRQAYSDLQAAMVPELGSVLFGSGELPKDIPVSKEVFIEWGLKLDRIYQLAARWLNHEPYMDYLRQNEINDIRGYYFIINTPGLLESLKDWATVSEDKKAQVVVWLKQVCLNSVRSKSRCSTLVDNAIQKNKAFDLFQKYKGVAASLIAEMMQIPEGVRFALVQWNQPQHVLVPFVDPQDAAMRSYLIDNIQEEWKFQQFQLEVSMTGTGRGVQVIWQPGITPHVPGLGSGTIYMDANAPISEYDVQWTIRHEFGHVLGFPDCYMELYDSTAEAIVSYQLDTTNLMCSRQGHLQQTHVDEMHRVYGQ